MPNSASIYWYDLETFGIDPRKDRIQLERIGVKGPIITGAVLQAGR